MAGYPTESIEILPQVEVPTLSTAAFKALLDSKQDFVFLDLRNPIDAAKIWIEDRRRIVIAFEDLPQRIGELPQGKKIIIFDTVGRRTPIAARYLYGKGFTDMEKVGGGMNQWVKDGYPTRFGR